MTTLVSIAQGGTGANNATQARLNLGITPASTLNVSANGGTTKLTETLNFINTSSVVINVSNAASTTNVSFDVIAGLGFVRDSFVGDGNEVDFTLSGAPVNEDNSLVFVDRVLQRNSEYNVSATTLTFTAAPDNGSVIDVFVTQYLSGNAAVLRTGDTMTGELNVSAKLITQNIEPAANITYDLGTNTKRFKDLWLSNSTIYLGDVQISANAGKLVVPAVETSSGINLESQVANSYAQANAAYGQANLAYAAANNSNLKLGGLVSGTLNVTQDLIVGGNIYLEGNTTYINVATYSVEDSLIYMASNNSLTDSVDIGFMGGKNTGGSYAHTGFARDATDGKWKLFDGLAEEGHVGNVVDFANTYLATLVANVEANTLTVVNGISGNVNFDSGTLFVDSVGDKVGIGTASPGSKLSVRGSTNLGDSHNGALDATYSTRISGYALYYDASNRYGSYGKLIFNSNANWTGDARRFLITNGLDTTKFAIIRSVDATTDPDIGNYSGQISSGTADFVINNAGNVGIGTTSPDFKLDVRGGIGSNSAAPLTFTGGPGGVNNEGTWNRTVFYSAQNNTTNSLENGVFIERGRLTDSPGAEIRNFVVGSRGGQVQFVVNKNGSVGLGGETPATSGVGIKFPASQSAVSDANTLDDYEEGTWTPALRGAITAGTYELGTTYATYTKIGRLVTLSLYMQLAGAITGGGTAYAQITGAPFTKASNTVFSGSVRLTGVDFTGSFVTCEFVSASSTSVLYFAETVDNGNSIDMPISAFSAGDVVSFTITYFTDT